MARGFQGVMLRGFGARDHQATVLLSVYHGQQAAPVAGPQVRVLAMVGSEPMRWPPFTVSPLDDGRLCANPERLPRAGTPVDPDDPPGRVTSRSAPVTPGFPSCLRTVLT